MTIAWGRVKVRGYAICADAACQRRFPLPARPGRPPKYCPWHARQANGQVRRNYRLAS